MFKIDGRDKKYPNLKESTGYPDDILGLGGVNCRHRMFPFFPGISTPNPIRFNEEENRRVYELTQKQRAMERRMRQLKKEQAAAKEIGDKETAKKLNEKITEQSTKIDEFCKKNGLRRDHSRELVKEQITPKKNVAKSENSGIIEKKSNREVREWYISEVSNIPNTIDETLPLEEQARQAFEKRNLIRSKAREMMADKEMRNILETEKPNMTFDELIASKMKRKGLTRKEAQIDILKTATKTNKNVNKELGLDGD